jgi:1-acyl-sn-glycerol-3-phosphate acyltransferase
VLPPRIFRRLILAPLVILITIAVVVLSPLLALIGVVATPSRSGRRRVLRLLWFSLSWLVMESLALVACLGLWIVSGFGGRLRSEASMDRHYALVRWFLGTLFRRAVTVFRLKVEIDEPLATPEEQAARLTRPVIVLSRHAGPGDSFLLIHQLLSRYGRKPRIVMKAALQFDPSIDVVINRLPHAFVRPRRARAHRHDQLEAAPVPSPGAAVPAEPAGPPVPAQPGPRAEPVLTADRTVPVDGLPSNGSGPVDESGVDGSGDSAVIEEIRRLASGLGPSGALVIFPEGGNFTPSRWRGGVVRLVEARRYREAARAARMRNLLPPRSGGAFAAIDAAPTADVIFVAHTGLDDLITVGDVWRALPMEQLIRARWWRVPAAEVPREREEVLRWLYDWWERIDTWIAENRPVRPVSAGDANPTTPSPQAIQP